MEANPLTDPLDHRNDTTRWGGSLTRRHRIESGKKRETFLKTKPEALSQIRLATPVHSNLTHKPAQPVMVPLPRATRRPRTSFQPLFQNQKNGRNRTANERIKAYRSRRRDNTAARAAISLHVNDPIRFRKIPRRKAMAPH